MRATRPQVGIRERDPRFGRHSTDEIAVAPVNSFASHGAAIDIPSHFWSVPESLEAVLSRHFPAISHDGAKDTDAQKQSKPSAAASEEIDRRQRPSGQLVHAAMSCGRRHVPKCASEIPMPDPIQQAVMLQGIVRRDFVVDLTRGSHVMEKCDVDFLSMFSNPLPSICLTGSIPGPDSATEPSCNCKSSPSWPARPSPRR
jgi:hypothetical protein